MIVTYRPSRYGDINAVAPRMRAVEVAECEAMGHTPKRALHLGYIASHYRWTVEFDGRPEGMFGVTPIDLLDRSGRPWFLGTDEVVKAGRQWMTVAPTFIDRMMRVYSHLENHVHRDNAASQRWLKRLGFTIEAETVDIGGQPMRRFWRRNDV